MGSPTVLVLTPVKNAAAHLDRYFDNLAALDVDPASLSLGLLVSDSDDGTYAEVERRLPELRQRHRRVTLVQRDFGLHLPEGVHRWSAAYQAPRRSVLARGRNHLLFAALGDEEWVLWMDVDLHSYPATIIRDLLAVGRDIVHPHCVTRPGGRSFDGNSWRDGGHTRMDALRGRGPVRLESVGGTMLLIRADLHRDGLVFPAFPYGVRSPHLRGGNPVTGPLGGELETEGLALLAKDMGHEVWGLPDVEVVHQAH